MNMQQNKQFGSEMSRTKSLTYRPRKISDKTSGLGDEARKRALSKISVLGSLGSRIFFHKRADRMKIPRYQNTYRLEGFRKFRVEVVDQILRETMEKKLTAVTSYYPHQSAKLCAEIANDVQRGIVKKDYDRYKIVVQMSIVQRLHQSVHTGFQWLWDSERDHYSYQIFENNHIYAWCCAFALYYEGRAVLALP